MLEVQDVPQVGSAPLVDRLVWVADHAEIVVSREVANEQVLRTIGVLVLVDHHVAELLRVALAHGRRLLEELHRLEEQIVEVERVGLFERLRIGGKERADLFVAAGPCAWNTVIGLHPILRVTDS